MWTQLLSYSFLPVAATLAGTVYSVLRTPGERLRSAVQHFAAGVVFSVVTVELMPDIVRGGKPWFVVLGFSVGIGVMLLIRFLTRGVENTAAQKEALPVAMLAAVGIDILIDGFLIGIGFSAGATEGRLLAFALAVEFLSLGLALGATLRRRVGSRTKVMIVVASLSLLVVVGALLGGILLHVLPGSWMEAILSFGLAALLYLVTEELLTEAHEVPETPWVTACFFAGFLLFVVLGMAERRG